VLRLVLPSPLVLGPLLPLLEVAGTVAVHLGQKILDQLTITLWEGEEKRKREKER